MGVLRNIALLILVTSWCIVADESACGGWQNKYKEFHEKAIRSPSSNQKYVIAIAPPQGLADRIGGFVSYFLFALVTNRIFLVATPDHLSPMDYAYASDHLKLNIPSNVPFDKAMMNMKVNGYDKTVDKSDTFGFYLNAGVKMTRQRRTRIKVKSKNLFVNSNFHQQPPGGKSKRIVFLGNRGFSWSMFSNAHHNATLLSFGLRKQSAFKCVFDYLFQFRPSSCKGTCVVFHETILSHQAAGGVVIGVQIRLGDTHITKENDFRANNTLYQQNGELHSLIAGSIDTVADKYMSCALDLVNGIATAQPSPVLLLVISDSLELRKRVHTKYGSDFKILTDVTTPPSHTYYTSSRNKMVSNDQQKKAFQEAASDLHIFSLANYHIISYRSGFGQKAAFLSSDVNERRIYYPDVLHRTEEGSMCRLDNYMDPDVAAVTWSGI